MLEADSWTRTGKLVRFSAEAELSKVIFRRASQEVLQAVEEMLHQVPPLESETCTSPKSCPLVLSVQVWVAPFLKITVLVPLVKVAPAEIARLATTLISPEPAVNTPEAPPPIVALLEKVASPAPWVKVAPSCTVKVPAKETVPEPAVNTPDAPPPMDVVPAAVKAELPPMNVASSFTLKVPLMVIAGLFVAAVIIPALVPSPIKTLPATVLKVAGKVKVISSAEGAIFKLP